MQNFGISYLSVIETNYVTVLQKKWFHEISYFLNTEATNRVCNDKVHGLAYMNDTGNSGKNACRHCERHGAKFISSSFRSFARRILRSFVVAHTQFNLTCVFRIIITTTHELLCSIVVVRLARSRVCNVQDHERKRLPKGTGGEDEPRECVK